MQQPLESEADSPIQELRIPERRSETGLVSWWVVRELVNSEEA